MRKGKQYPVKTTINLAQRERKHRDLGAVIPTAIVLAVAIGAFCKFGVVDRLSQAAAAEAEAARQGQLLAELSAQTADYEQVTQEYQSYVLSESAMGGGADPMACLALVEEELLGAAKVSSFTVSPDTITVKLSGVTLNDISAIYQRLMASELVGGVQVYTAATEQAKNDTVTAALTIRLAVEPADGEGAAS